MKHHYFPADCYNIVLKTIKILNHLLWVDTIGEKMLTEGNVMMLKVHLTLPHEKIT